MPKQKHGREREEVRRTGREPEQQPAAPRPERPAVPSPALGDARLDHPANVARRAALVRSGQQSLGNRALQRAVHPQPAPVSPQGLLEEVSQEIEQQRGGGSPLDAAVQSAWAPLFGHDLSGVRIHADPPADRLAGRVAATAFATGPDIFFRAGAYQPASTAGQRLLAHEVAHVVQQGGQSPAGGPLAVSSPGDAFEEEAERAAEAVVANARASLSGVPPSLQRVTARFGVYAPTIYSELFNILRFLGSDLRQRLDEVPSTERVVGDVRTWNGDVDAWRTFYQNNMQDEIGEAMVGVAQGLWDRCVQLREDITRCKQRLVRERLSEARSAISSAATALQEHNAELDEAKRAAFLKNDPDVMGQVMNFVGNAVSIGMGLHDLSRDISGAIAELRGDTIPEASRYARWLGRINRILAAAGVLYSLAQEPPPAQLSAALANVNTLAGAFSAGATLLNVAPHIGLYATLYLAPMTQVITANLDRILGRHLHDLNVVSSVAGLQIDMSNEPGGWPLFYFMLSVMGAGGPDGVPWPAPREVESFLVSRREVIAAGARNEEGEAQEVPTTGWWFWRRLDPARAREYIFQNRQSLWAMFYGRMAVPRPDQVPRGRR